MLVLYDFIAFAKLPLNYNASVKSTQMLVQKNHSVENFMHILSVGLNHKTASVSLREKLSFSSATLCAFLDRLDDTPAPASAIRETTIISTCNRLEYYALTNHPDAATREIISRLSQTFNLSPAEFEPHLYQLLDDDAIDHLMHVACGLDSLVLGEAQILGQVASAHQIAQAHGASGKILGRLFDMAIHAGKRARTETHIGMNPASVSSVAVHLALDFLGNLAEKTVMVLGAGEMGMLTLQAAAKFGAQKFIVVNRTRENAEKRAIEWQAQPLTFDEIEDGLRQSDLVITATGAPHTVLHRDSVAEAIAVRPDRPLLIVDIALPRDVDDDVIEIPGVRLYNLDDLQHQVADNLQARRREIPKVEKIIAEEKTAFQHWLRARDVVPTIAAFRQQMDAIRRQEVERTLHRLPDLNDQQKAIVAELAHRLTNKFLHHPTVRLRAEAANGNGVAFAHALHELFALEKPTNIE